MRSVGVILLAAGGSVRMGQPKQLLPFRGTTLLRHAAEFALEANFSPVVVVLGAEETKCRAELAGLEVAVAVNPDWAAGMGSSLRVGVASIEKNAPQLEAVLVMLHDQPLITAADLRSLVELWDSAPHPIAAAFYQGAPGVPVVFGRSIFDDLKALPPAEGAKKILLRHASQVAILPLPAAARDIDSPEDYDRLSGDEIVP